jgi:hypothetical protein
MSLKEAYAAKHKVLFSHFSEADFFKPDEPTIHQNRWHLMTTKRKMTDLALKRHHKRYQLLTPK